MKQASGKNYKSPSSSGDNIREYLLSSSLHGLRYIGTTTLSVFERVFFGLSFIIVIFLAGYFISNVYQKWRETPVIIGLDPVSTNIKDIPFPAVTICNMNQVRKDFAARLKSRKDKVILDSICTQGDGLDNEDANIEGKWSYIRDFLLNSSQPCEDMITDCKFGMQNFDCDKSFSSVLTDEGLCCSFNAVHPRLLFKEFEKNEYVDEFVHEDVEYMTWTPEKGYAKTSQTPYPAPVPGPGSNMGLTLILNADVANYYCSSTSSSGFKVLLHSPIETPKVANYGFFIATGLETKVVISPKISESSDLIRKIPIQQRQCIFANEANLSYYNIYSKKNCEMECSSKLTEQSCNCTLYFMPRKFNNGSKICNRKKASCYEQILYNIAYSHPEYSCNYCLPACFEINYGREISSARLGTGGFLTVQKISPRSADYIQNNLAIIHIFFIDNAYGGFTKSELIGFTEFLSNTGGLLGLFMGFSVISLIEIIYFLSLRPYCASNRNGKQQEQQQGKQSHVADERKQFHNRHYMNGLRGANKTTLVSPQLNEYYMRTEQVEQQNFCKDALFKLVSAFRYIKAKLSSAWNALVEMFNEQKDEGQAPFPYYN